MLKFDVSHANLKEDITSYQDEVTRLHELLETKQGKGNDYTGWLDWANTYDKEEYARIKEVAKKYNDCDVFLVCGIGGSYLGSRAVLEMSEGLFPKREKPEIIFIGNTFSSTYVAQVLEYIKGKNVAMNVISKSGTTTETALAFRMLRQYLETTYGKDGACDRIVATTDAKNGTLRELADKEGYETFIIPEDIGGRFSVITPVGLFPLAVAGVDTDAFMEGLKLATEELSCPQLDKNVAYQYAVARHILYKEGYKAEMLVSYESQMTMFAEWWKQLFGESEGKNSKGLLPCSVNFSTDLHSLGQFIQDGSKMLFETVIQIEKPMMDVTFPSDNDNIDQMNYLSGKSLHWVNQMAFEGTLEAHEVEGNVPNLLLTLDSMEEKSIGYIMYFYFRAIAMSVYLLDENPFNQPGVEVYKRNMFRLLGKN